MIETIEKEKTETKVFAQELKLDQLVWIFLIGSVLGTVYEEILCLFQFGEWQSRRGLIYGPVNPVYGAGFVLLVVLLHRFKKVHNLILVGGFVGGLFEYTIWALQRAFFKTESWNYKSFIYINGKQVLQGLFWGGTSLFHAIGWGIVSALALKILYPFILHQLAKIPPHIGHKLTIGFIIFFLLDSLISLVALKRQEARHICAETMQCQEPNFFEKLIDTIYNDDFLKLIYPNMTLELESE